MSCTAARCRRFPIDRRRRGHLYRPSFRRNGGMAPALRRVRWFDSLVVMIGLLCRVAYLCRASSVSGRCLSHIFRTQGQPANRAHQRYGCVEWNDRPLGYRRDPHPYQKHRRSHGWESRDTGSKKRGAWGASIVPPETVDVRPRNARSVTSMTTTHPGNGFDAPRTAPSYQNLCRRPILTTACLSSPDADGPLIAATASLPVESVPDAF